jgi:hypothetical protein
MGGGQATLALDGTTRHLSQGAVAFSFEKFFGKLFFSVAPFLNNSRRIDSSILSEIVSAGRYVYRPRLFRTILARLRWNSYAGG